MLGDTVSHTVGDDVVCCTKLVCRQAAFRLNAEKALKAKAEDHRRRHQQDIAAARAYLREYGWSHEKAEAVSIGLVPYSDRSVKPANKARQAEFLRNLEQSLREFLAPDYEYEKRIIDYGPPGFESAHVAGCTACRGDCCKLGDTHAFLKPYRLEKLIDRGEENALETALERYAGYLPEESVEGSCVFHTARGCALPRSSCSL